MSEIYTPNDWYWAVAGDEQRVWSSAARDWVAPGAPGYVAFLSTGNVAAAIVDEALFADTVNAPIFAAIAAIEARQARPLRDIALGLDVSGTAIARLQALENEIAALRAAMATVPL